MAVDSYSFVDNPRMRLPSLVFALAYYLHTGACIFFAIAPPSMDELDELESPMEQYSWAFGRVVAFTIGSAYAISGALNPLPFLPPTTPHACTAARTQEDDIEPEEAHGFFSRPSLAFFFIFGILETRLLCRPEGLRGKKASERKFVVGERGLLGRKKCA